MSSPISIIFNPDLPVLKIKSSIFAKIFAHGKAQGARCGRDSTEVNYLNRYFYGKQSIIGNPRRLGRW